MTKKASVGGNHKTEVVYKKDASSGTQRIGLEQFKAQIEKRAAEVYQERVAANRKGDALSDWLVAESEIKKRNNIS